MRRAANLAGPVVGVRLHGQQVGIHRQRVGVANHVSRFAGCDLDRLRPQAQDGWRARGRAVTEVQPNFWQHLLDRTTRLQMQLHHQVAAGFERPRQIGRHERRHLARRPPEEVAVGILRRPRHQAVIAGQRIGLVQLACGVRAIDADIGVMHHAAVAGMKLDAAHVRAFRHRQADGENAKGVGRLRGQRVGAGRLDDQIRLAQQPPIGHVG